MLSRVFFILLNASKIIFTSISTISMFDFNMLLMAFVAFSFVVFFSMMKKASARLNVFVMPPSLIAF